MSDRTAQIRVFVVTQYNLSYTRFFLCKVPEFEFELEFNGPVNTGKVLL